MSDLMAEDLVKNLAAIYFDFNAPVVTNTAVTRVVLPTGISGFNAPSSKFNVYPNPAKDYFEIRIGDFGMKENIEIGIFDMYGRGVYKSAIRNSDRRFIAFAGGLYY